MDGLKNWWGGFCEKHPKLAEWVRKGGLFLLFSYFVTFLKALLLMFLPDLFRGIVGNAEWLWPNIPVSLFDVQFNLAIIGNALEEIDGVISGGLAFTLANLVTICFGECINFPLQRNVTFKSHGPLGPQIGLHLRPLLPVGHEPLQYVIVALLVHLQVPIDWQRKK